MVHFRPQGACALYLPKLRLVRRTTHLPGELLLRSRPLPAVAAALFATCLTVLVGLAPQVASADSGPGGPILVLAPGSTGFGRYLPEILRAEGFNDFAVADPGDQTAAQLDSFDVVLLAQAALSAGQVNLLTAWVGVGGALIAMRPDPQLAGLLGLSAPGGALANGTSA